MQTGATGVEPAISGLTGQCVNHYTTPPRANEILPEVEMGVNMILLVIIYLASSISTAVIASSTETPVAQSKG